MDNLVYFAKEMTKDEELKRSLEAEYTSLIRNRDAGESEEFHPSRWHTLVSELLHPSGNPLRWILTLALVVVVSATVYSVFLVRSGSPDQPIVLQQRFSPENTLKSDRDSAVSAHLISPVPRNTPRIRSAPEDASPEVERQDRDQSRKERVRTSTPLSAASILNALYHEDNPEKTFPKFRFHSKDQVRLYLESLANRGSGWASEAHAFRRWSSTLARYSAEELMDMVRMRFGDGN